MKSKSLALIFFVFSVFTLSACGFKRLKNVGPESSAITYNIDQIGYKEVNDLVFKPNCISCHNQSNHSGSIILDTYVSVKANLGLVQGEVVGQTMPPDAPLPGNQIQLVSNWIGNGAPEFAAQQPSVTPTPVIHPTPTSTPVPTPTPSVLVANYMSIRANVFVPKCLSCHSAGASQSRLPLDNYEKMMANSSMIKVGNPAKSTVYIEVAGGTMPPRHRNPVTGQEIAVIQTWIQNGAPKGE